MRFQPNGAVLTRSQGLEVHMKNKDFPSPFVLDENKAGILGNSWKGGRPFPPKSDIRLSDPL